MKPTPNWDVMEAEVVRRIRILRDMTGSDRFWEHGELAEKIWDDLVMPSCRLLAAFCASVTVEEDKP